ncbi:MAG: ankyrin repeat domain-containing protein [bacterium]
MNNLTKVFFSFLFSIFASNVNAQIPPSTKEIENYPPLLAAAYAGDVLRIKQLLNQGLDVEQTDASDRTSVHIAAFASQNQAIQLLADAGANLNALEFQAYDIVTIAAVANDVELLDLSLALGANAGNVTSPYEGTALIAAAHLGHHEIVKSLIKAGAPLDHINNLGWTALMEAVILGNGGPNHIETVRALVDSGADQTIPDREGVSPLQHAITSNYTEIISILSQE